MKVLKRYSALLLTILLTLGCLTGCGMEEPSNLSSSLEDTDDSILSGFDDTLEQDTTTTTTTTTKKITTTTTTTKKPTTTSRITTTERTEELPEMVWIPQSGKKYHSHSDCSGMINPSQVSLFTAKEMGYTPCKRCYG